MVFIVKIPNHNRSRGNTPDPSSEAPELPPADPEPQQPATSDAEPMLPSQGPVAEAKDRQPLRPAGPAALDILLAPAVLNHRYVRGVDKSLIVERPERIRAVLLGVAGAIGSHPQSQGQQQEGARAAVKSESSAGDAADDLVAQLSSLSVRGDDARTGAPPPFRVLHSTRSLSLDPPHPSVGYVHAHSDEMVEVLESAYAEAKRKRHQARQARLDVDVEADVDLDPTITSASTAAAEPEAQQQGTRAAPSSSHAAYIHHLASRAPSEPPLSQAAQAASRDQKGAPASSSSTAESDDYTSSDGEGDDAMHPSEIPQHLPQGDLYLAGATDERGDGGSSQAIRHAMGACAEAVDRVVAAARAERQTGGGPSARPLSELAEVRYDDQAFARGETSDATEPPASRQEPGDGIGGPPSKRAFVLSRPPGHHCSGSSPSGFCWINNAVVAAAHGYLDHGIDRVVVFDIDLHHGNGTQALAWRINADSQRHDLDREAQLEALRASAVERNRAALKSGPRGRQGAAAAAAAAASLVDQKALEAQVGPRGLRIFYSSIHDIESFPCEDGDPDLIRDASVCVEGAHGQWIWNVHLDHYRDEDDFYRLYDERYSALFDKARRFLERTDARPESTLVLISAGFDACSYEYPGMQRHGKHVPPSFYDRFARDSVRFSERWAEGKVISVLEGGYSDRALCSAAMAHVMGLAGTTATPGAPTEPAWRLENLVHLEKMSKKMAASAAAAIAGSSTPSAARRRGPEPPAWVSRSSVAFAAFERCCGKKEVYPLGVPSPAAAAAAASQSQARAKRSAGASLSAASSPGGSSAATGRVLRDRSALKQRSAWDPSSPSAVAGVAWDHAEGAPSSDSSLALPSPTEAASAQFRPTAEIKAEQVSESTPPAPTAPPTRGPSSQVDAAPTTSRIGSVTPKADGIQTTPVTLVDAMHHSFPSTSPSHPSRGGTERTPTYVTANSAADDGDRQSFAEGLHQQQRRSSLGLVGQDGSTEMRQAAHPLPGAFSSFELPAATGPSHEPRQAEMLPVEADAMQFYKQQMAMQQLHQQHQQAVPPVPGSFPHGSFPHGYPATPQAVPQLPPPSATTWQQQPGGSTWPGTEANAYAYAAPPAAPLQYPVGHFGLYPPLPPQHDSVDDPHRQQQ
ncbi:uncharacterized protein PFL1_04618 [Pseudozyma flocculosa PF-1]|uniref:Histone deacetylase domain-containing protein n=1 Tax=Pseudozyma flocculosa PF-1 TaxID=1277687 RepID=A0A061H5X9_9BASI|nr:uncharacterized protein PFL1_04618 [Pseudozyma flocculosa PF-1]EPQ27874.1 hypothetical protein PFL1_04618 [Pseudozyma flocculosa PF-1]